MGLLDRLLGRRPHGARSHGSRSAVEPFHQGSKWTPPPHLKHYLAYVEDIKAAKRSGDLMAAKRLALLAIESTEDESRMTGTGVAPWYYEQAAIICRKQGDTDGELAILERYARQKHAAGAKPPKLMERLRKLKLDSSRGGKGR